MHTEALAFLETVSDRIMRTGVALDIGGGGKLGEPSRAVFGGSLRWDVLEPEPGEGVTLLADATSWQSPYGWDLVICTEVLEHVGLWRNVVANAVRAVVPGGSLVITCAGPGRKPHSMHGYEHPAEGEHYQNIRPEELASTLIGLTVTHGLWWRELIYDPGPCDIYAWLEVDPGA